MKLVHQILDEIDLRRLREKRNWVQQQEEERRRAQTAIHRAFIERLDDEALRFEDTPLAKRERLDELDPGLQRLILSRYNNWIAFKPRIEKFFEGEIPTPILWQDDRMEYQHMLWLYHAHWKALLWSVLQVSQDEKLSFNRLTRRLNETRPNAYRSGRKFIRMVDAIKDYLSVLEQAGYVKVDPSFFWKDHIDFNEPLIQVLYCANQIPVVAPDCEEEDDDWGYSEGWDPVYK
jgi:hypothetical protein